MTARAVMVLGTTSGAGKSWLAVLPDPPAAAALGACPGVTPCPCLSSP